MEVVDLSLFPSFEERYAAIPAAAFGDSGRTIEQMAAHT